MMTLRFPTEWIAQARDALARLVDQPWALFVVLLAVNTLTRPYAGITHDTRLYSAQVLNRVETGAYADDLFFRYGSQDEYSIFSRLAAPLVHVLGLPLAFFLIYLASKTLLLWGMIRLVRTLVPNRTAVALALVYCMIATIHYGGLKVLNIQETFITPRMPAIALTLVALDAMLRGRAWLSAGLLGFALAIHPLMAFGGVLVWTGFQLWTWFGFRIFAATALGVAAVAGGVLVYAPLATRLFGPMDDTWRQTIMHASSFNFPAQWGREDWWYFGFQLALAAMVIWKFHGVDDAKGRFVTVAALVAIAGAVGAVVAEQMPYALLLQGQPYRAMWVLAFLHVALVFWLFVDWSEHPALPVQLAGCGLLAYGCNFDGLFVEMLFPLFVLPFFVLSLRGLEKSPRDPAWLTHSIQFSLVVGGLVWLVYKVYVLSTGADALAELHPEMRDIFEVYLKNLGPIALAVGLACLLVRFGIPQSRRAVWLTGAACVAAQACIFAFAETDYYRDHYTRYRGDLRDVRAAIDADRVAGKPLPTVYCNLGCLDYIWLDLHAKSYFDWWQAGGFMFRREMAMEGQRRAQLVGPFELERYRRYKHELTEGDKYVIGRFFKADFDRVKLEASDLARLCQEPGLDFIVVEQEFEGLVSSRHGMLYLYKCQDVRTALGLPAAGAAWVAAR